MRGRNYLMSTFKSLFLPILVAVSFSVIMILASFSSAHTSNQYSYEIPKEHISLLRMSSLNASWLFSFVHISKCAGNAWINELQKYLTEDRVYGVWHEYSVHMQEKLVSKTREPHYRLISLKSPRHHVWSMFTECKYDDWGKRTTNGTTFPRSGSDDQHDEEDFDTWLNHFLTETTHNNGSLETWKFPISEIDDYNCYHPANYQSRALTSTTAEPHHVDMSQDNHKPIFEPNATLAIENYWNHDWVGLADFFHESKCLLLHRLTFIRNNETRSAIHDYLHATCRCDDQSNPSNKTVDIKVIHHQEAHRASLLNLPLHIQSKVDTLTRIDAHVYKVALLQFLREMIWLESDDALGRRILCDDVMEKMDAELFYLNVSLIHQYHLLQQVYETKKEMEDYS